MRAMVLRTIAPIGEGRDPLGAEDWPDPIPGDGEVRILIKACGVCHTELDEIEGRARPPHLRSD